MITVFIINTVLLLLGFIFLIFPDVTLLSLPFGIGAYVVALLTNMTLTWNALAETLPYTTDLKNAIIHCISFKILILTLKLFFGHRSPIHT